MKDVVKNEIVNENQRKIFTKNDGKGIIKNNNKLLLTKDIVLNSVLNGLSFKEKILVRMFSKTFLKVYRKGMIECFNYYNK